MATTTTVKVVAPGAGESVTEGEILEWHVSEGDQIEADATIVEISTDKVDVEVPSPVTGTVVKLHAAEGETITVGQLLAEIDPAGGAPADAAPADSEPASNGSNGGAPTEPEGSGEVIDIITPTGGESVTEAEILEWSVKVGDSVQEGDAVV